MSTKYSLKDGEIVDGQAFASEALQAVRFAQLQALLKQLPIVGPDDYVFNRDNPTDGWREGHLHWIPLGKETGNGGRIRLSTRSEGPLAERAINSMEALIELERQRELKLNPHAACPQSTAEAVKRYFNLPPLHELPNVPRSDPIRKKAAELARRIVLKIDFDKPTHEITVRVTDQGIGQGPARIHETLLSLGASDKGDKPYLIGIFGQGGSSSYSVCELSWCMSRRHPDVCAPGDDGLGWTAIQRIYPHDRRDDHWAYLAATPDGRVPKLSASAADANGYVFGTTFCHLRYDLNIPGGGEIGRSMFPALNHILCSPPLPIFTQIGGTDAPVWGNAYRLVDARRKRTVLEYKSLPNLEV
jgi:hypothetical protein